MNALQKIYRQTCPSFFPTIFSEDISNWINEAERLFKQPIKNVFPYPMDIKKIVDKETGKLKSLSFQIALAGLEKDEIKVQLKDKKYLTITVQKGDNHYIGEDDENSNEYSEYISNGISYRNAEVSFRIFQDIDLERFKPVYKNGLLTIDLYVKEQEKNQDVIDAVIQ